MSSPRFDEDLGLAQVALRFGAALTTAIAVGIFFVILFIARTG